MGWNAKEFIKGTQKTYSLEKKGKEQGHMNNEELASMFQVQQSIYFIKWYSVS